MAFFYCNGRSVRNRRWRKKKEEDGEDGRRRNWRRERRRARNTHSGEQVPKFAGWLSLIPSLTAHQIGTRKGKTIASDSASRLAVPSCMIANLLGSFGRQSPARADFGSLVVCCPPVCTWRCGEGVGKLGKGRFRSWVEGVWWRGMVLVNEGHKG